MHSLIRSQQISIGCFHEWRIYTNESYMMIQVWNPLPGVNGMWVAVDTMQALTCAGYHALHWAPTPTGQSPYIYAVVVHRIAESSSLLRQH
jgi:hypothetical protein